MNWSRLYETAVYGPLAEQLVEAAGVRRGMRLLDVDPGGGVLTRRCAGVVGQEGRVVAAVRTAGDRDELRDELRAARVAVDVVLAAGALPWSVSDFDLAVSLHTADGAGDGAVMEQMRRVATQVAVLRIEPAHSPAALLARTWRDVTGSVPQSLSDSGEWQVPGGWSADRLHDVARFDGAAQVWTALLEHLRCGVPDVAREELRARFDGIVAQYAGADGTLRIPIEAWLLQPG